PLGRDGGRGEEDTVLLLSLLVFGQHAEALSYRSGGSNNIKAYFNYPRSFKPAPSGEASSAQPGGFLVGSGSSFTEGGSSADLKPAAQSEGGYSGPQGWRVDGYSPERSVSTYRPRPPIIQKPRPNPQPPQTNPSSQGVPQTKAGMWEFPFLQNTRSVGMGVSSSPGIDMQSRHQIKLDYVNPSKPSYPSKPVPQPSYPSKPVPQPSYPSKPVPQPSYPSKPVP
ncbi:protein piccolo-like, partial [Plectropomus leopardus]|uniref:protein piccolo-like n=1 Tax=Plectropomus leopardus TaxID=160734 RepID=UPI001C4B0044